MKTTFTVLVLFLFLSCSNIKYIERKADKGDITFCLYTVIHYTEQTDYKTDKKAQEKIIKYCKKGLSISIDTNSYNPKMDYAIFYRELAKSSLTKKTEKYAYYLKAAEYGDGESQWIASLYYLDGKGGKTDNDSALYWMKKAANGNSYIYSSLAEKELGDIFMEGKLVKPDTLIALYYYKKSCACNREYSNLLGCDKVVEFYKKQANLTDTTELAIYEELRRQLSRRNNIR